MNEKKIGLGDLVRVVRTGKIGIVRRDHMNGTFGVSFDGSWANTWPYYSDELEIIDNSACPSVWKCDECGYANFGHETYCVGCEIAARFR